MIDALRKKPCLRGRAFCWVSLLCGRQLRVKLGFAVGEQDNLQRAFLAFHYRRAFNLDLVAIYGCVLHFERAASTQLESVVECCAGG
jgi:hypothetical protein